MAEGEGFGKIVRLGATLCAVTAVTGCILGAVDAMTKLPIEQAALRMKSESMRRVMDVADEFEELEIEDPDMYPIVREVQAAKSSGKTVGWCVTVAPRGYAGEVVMIVGIAPDGTVRAVDILDHSETPGLGAKAREPRFIDQFRGRKFTSVSASRSPSGDDEIQAISGATRTSNAAASGVSTALRYWRDALKGRE